MVGPGTGVTEKESMPGTQYRRMRGLVRLLSIGRPSWASEAARNSVIIQCSTIQGV